MFKKTPINIVLLPPQEIMDVAIEYSRRAYERGEQRFLRNLTDRLPHITMLTGSMHEAQKDEIINRLEHIATGVAPISITITDHKSHGGLAVKKTKELIDLHELIVKQINLLLHQDGELKDLHEDLPLNEDSSISTNIFISERSGDNFRPHISTSNRTVEPDFTFPMSGVCDTIALCPSGDKGTCRTPIVTYKLY